MRRVLKKSAACQQSTSATRPALTHAHTRSFSPPHKRLPSRRLILPSQYKLVIRNCAGPETIVYLPTNRVRLIHKLLTPFLLCMCAKPTPRFTESTPRGRNSARNLPICSLVRIGYPLVLLAPPAPLRHYTAHHPEVFRPNKSSISSTTDSREAPSVFIGTSSDF
ncbi:hypothetical protein VTI28DRAFT_10225 [Corynascus sepedonium]